MRVEALGGRLEPPPPSVAPLATQTAHDERRGQIGEPRGPTQPHPEIVVLRHGNAFVVAAGCRERAFKILQGKFCIHGHQRVPEADNRIDLLTALKTVLDGEVLGR